jgi:hypothetical protein
MALPALWIAEGDGAVRGAEPAEDGSKRHHPRAKERSSNQIVVWEANEPLNLDIVINRGWWGWADIADAGRHLVTERELAGMDEWLDPGQLEPEEPEEPQLLSSKSDHQSRLQVMNKRFVAAMAAAIRAGLERPPRVGIDPTPGTKSPLYLWR